MSEPSVFAAVETDLPGRIFRVSRPGRGTCGSKGCVSEEVIRTWMDGVWRHLDVPATPKPLLVDYVCLLGKKKDGRREIWDFYPARAPDDPPERPLFEDVLNRLGGGRMSLRVHHVPTVDHEAVEPAVVAKVETLLRALLQADRVVLIGCSAAQGRTMEILEAIKWVIVR